MREKPGLLRGALTALFIIHCIISSCFASAPTTLDPADWDGREFVLGGLDIDGRVIQLRGPVLQVNFS